MQGRISQRKRGAAVGLGGGLVLVAAALVVPRLADWEVYARSTGGGVPPLHGFWHPTVLGPGTLPALVIAVVCWLRAGRVAATWSWPRLLLAGYLTGLGWYVALALVDGESGLTRTMDHGYDYLHTARETTDVGATLEEYVARIDADHPDNWTVHVAGHPPLALMFFVGLVRLGLGGSLAAGLVVTTIGATAALGVLETVRVLGAEDLARRAAPVVVLSPAAVFMAVSADAVFAAVAAWGLAALAHATRSPGRRWITWSAVAGLLLGGCVLMSYGLTLLGFLALAVLWLGRSWRPLPVAAAVAGGLVLLFAWWGFAWWEAYPALHERYWRGLAKQRPAAYWLWGNLAGLLLSAGPILAAGLGATATAWRDRADRVVVLLVAAAATAVLVADLSRMSKAEVERIWLPFVPWLLLSAALLPERWRRPALAAQLVTTLALQHLLYTSW